MNAFLHEDGKARCILVDSEPKVVARTAQLGTTAKYIGNSVRKRNLHCRESKSTGYEPKTQVVARSSLFRESNVFVEQFGRGQATDELQFPDSES